VKTIRVLGAVRLQHGETRAFSWPSAYGDLEGFVIRHGENLRAFENKCKHLPIPLDYGDGEFWYDAIDRIVCKTHGATYEPDTGYCDDGPCEGASLTRFDVELEGEDVVVLIPD
jgi:nitrite reductase/ring-hydroxylating ferredoxin subunit